MGSGKSSVGKQLAKLIDADFIDSDEEIEKRTGVSIAWIFEKENEAGFRKREREIIQSLCQRKNIIMGTGGGSILAEENREYLKSTGFIIYLKVSLDEQFARTNRRQGARPLLNEPNPKEKLDALNKSRANIYESLANLTIETDGKSPKEVAQLILEKMNFA
ncbi:MAG: shikimate kinase [Coxiellaceae bacterium]|nr:shikimate kinase [Coxiellaceae bacterium]